MRNMFIPVENAFAAWRKEPAYVAAMTRWRKNSPWLTRSSRQGAMPT